MYLKSLGLLEGAAELERRETSGVTDLQPAAFEAPHDEGEETFAARRIQDSVPVASQH
ncbi:MAG: hypothetical protein JNK87_27815 [Bryobacterales bacterium]|nr:hypothetical protein [Bryobacterales bacterium]